MSDNTTNSAPTLPDAFVPAGAREIIRASDWNRAQQLARQAISEHRHAGGLDEGALIDNDGLADGAVDGAKIDARSAVTVERLQVSREPELEEEVDAWLCAAV